MNEIYYWWKNKRNDLNGRQTDKSKQTNKK